MIVITAHGRLAHQPEVKLGPKTSFCEFRLLCTRFAGGGAHTEAVTFFCFGEEAERFCELTERGQLISATGAQETDRWTPAGGVERASVRYRLTWWQAGPRPAAARGRRGMPTVADPTAPAGGVAVAGTRGAF
jgi:single-stranded DNA-binding protein